MAMKYGTVGLLAVAVVAILISAPAPVDAHHSFAAQYDSNAPVTLTGAVTKVEWMNPHVYFYIDVRNQESGRTENWALEMGAPAVIQRRGWKQNTMKIGDMVTVEASRAKNGDTHANARSVIMADTGLQLGAGSSENVTP
jgi:hypothetical protein